MSKSNNPNGRPKGSPNKATKEIREVLTSAISNEIPHMVDCLERLRISDDKTYINAMAKLIAFVVPKPQCILSLSHSSSQSKKKPKATPHRKALITIASITCSLLR